MLVTTGSVSCVTGKLIDLRCMRTREPRGRSGTSENTRGILAVAVHFVNQTGTLVNLSIALCEVAGDHGGENLKAFISGIISEFGIATDMGLFCG